MFLSEDKVFLLLALGSQKMVTFGSKRSDSIRWLSPTHLWQVEDSTLVLIYPAEVSKQKAAIQHHMLRCRHARGFRRGRRKWQDMTAICGGDCGWGLGTQQNSVETKRPWFVYCRHWENQDFGVSLNSETVVERILITQAVYALYSEDHHQICPPATMTKMPVILNWLSRKRNDANCVFEILTSLSEHLTQDT